MKDKDIKCWFIVLAIALAIIAYFVYQNTQSISEDRQDLMSAVQALKVAAQSLAEDLDRLLQTLGQDLGQLSAEIQQRLAAAREALEGLYQHLVSAEQALASQLSQKLKDLSESGKAYLDNLEKSIQELQKQYEAIQSSVGYILREICQVPEVKSYISTVKFSLLDPKICAIKPSNDGCPRGYYGGQCKSKMCPGGLSSPDGIYNWAAADKWCSNNFADENSDSGCDGTQGLCVKKPLPVITGD